jgi:LysM repeat protein
MNNPNPFVPQGSLLEQNKRRSRMKLGVLCVLAVSITGLTAMLIQGCKRETESAENTPTIDTNTPEIDTNAPMMEASNPPVEAPVETNAPPPPVEAATTEYVVVKGDSFSKIAKKFGVSVRAVEDANPNIAPTKLQVGQKLTIPAATENSSAMAPTTSTGGEETYVVKSGDTLTRIARHYGVTVKAIESENNLSTTQIKVGQKLKIPASAAPPAPVTTPPAVSAPAVPETSSNASTSP